MVRVSYGSRSLVASSRAAGLIILFPIGSPTDGIGINLTGFSFSEIFHEHSFIGDAR